MCNSTYEFDWDNTKAATNLSKHGVRFEEAMTVFNDPLAMTRFEAHHSDEEERWVTLGLAMGGGLILVVRTYSAIDAQHVLIRIISARHSTRREARQYHEG